MEKATINTSCAMCHKLIFVRPSKYKPENNYCSRRCFYEWLHQKNDHKNYAVCKVCNKKFHVTPNRKHAKFCSHKCQGTTKTKLPKEYKECKECSKQFIPRRPSSKYCSTECRTNATKKPSIAKICCGCGNTFTDYPSGIRIYCTRKCMALARTSSLEKIGYKLLDEISISYFPQHLINNKFVVDAYIPSIKLVIQFDGDYWHANPSMYITPNKIQRNSIAKDKQHNAYMAKCGYDVYRIWECDLKNNPSKFKDDIINIIEDCRQ
jgi:very-short-patch-repair endonuclease